LYRILPKLFIKKDPPPTHTNYPSDAILCKKTNVNIEEKKTNKDLLAITFAESPIRE
jgi:hypothetical protein